jgi:hypothetical protein
MTAQDIDVIEFTTADLNLLRGKIADSTTGQPAVKVCRICRFNLEFNE